MANTSQRSDLRAGLFIVVSIALVIGVVVAIKGVRSIFTPVDVRHVRFSLKDDLGGLQIGDDVRLGGFKVGVIKTIEVQGLGDGHPASILVTFTMPKKYPIGKDAHVGIQTELTGSTNLNIDSLGGSEPLTDGTELTGHPSTLSALTASLGDAGPQVHDIITDFRTKTMPRINDAAAKASETLASIHTAADQMGSVFGDTKPDIRGTMANMNAITTDAKAKLPAILDHADKLMTDATATIANARSAMEDVKATVANTKAITANARDLIEGNRGKFDTIIASLKQSGDNLKAATAEVRRSPWRLLYHPGPGEIDNLELYDSARQFAEGASSVDDAALALRDAMKNPNVDRFEVQKLIGHLNDTFANFNTVERKLWTAVKPE